jgi:hypothetical protein
MCVCFSTGGPQVIIQLDDETEDDEAAYCSAFCSAPSRPGLPS